MREVDSTKSSEESASVGVLGWLGFVIINCAAWGIITVSSAINWLIGFVVVLLYCAGLLGGAFYLESLGKRYRSFVNLLWVLGCIFVFILGVYLSVNVVGPIFGDRVMGNNDRIMGNNGPPFMLGPEPSLESLLPDDASAELKHWAKRDEWDWGTDFAVFAASTFFSAAGNASHDRSSKVLFKTNGTHVHVVKPELTEVNNFKEYSPTSTSMPKLFFFGRPRRGQAGLYFMSHTQGRDDAAKLVYTPDVDDDSGTDLHSLFFDHQTKLLWFKASYSCAGLPITTIVKSSGSSDGTQDLWPNDCESHRGNRSPEDGEANSHDLPKPLSVIWSVLLLTDLPMMTLAVWALATKKLPGLFLNIYGGGYIAILLVYVLATDKPEYDFFKISVTIYTALGYLGLLLLEMRLVRHEARGGTKREDWIDDIKTWAVVIVGWPFFAIWHANLSMPGCSEVWKWFAFAAICVTQMFLAITLSRSFPMVMGAIGALEIAFKISFNVIELLGDSVSREIKTLTMLTVLAAQGVGIIVAAIYYANKRQKIDTYVQSLLFRCSGDFRQVDDAGLLANP